MPNLILCGFHRVGKSTIGKQLSEHLGLEFIDTDEEIRNRSLLSARDYYTKHGEEKFRKLEELVIEDIGSVHNTVISLGGGALLLDSNRKRVKKLGVLVCLTRSKDRLFSTIDESPSFVKQSLEESYQKRLESYRRASCFWVSVDQVDINSVLKDLWFGFR